MASIFDVFQDAARYDDPEYWRARGEEVRRLAANMKDRLAQGRMLRIAHEYDALGRLAEQRLRSVSNEHMRHKAFST